MPLTDWLSNRHNESCDLAALSRWPGFLRLTVLSRQAEFRASQLFVAGYRRSSDVLRLNSQHSGGVGLSLCCLLGAVTDGTPCYRKYHHLGPDVTGVEVG